MTLRNQCADDREFLEPERELWATVIHQALEDLAAGRGGSCAGQLRGEALAWILSGDQDVGTFNWCCAQIGIDPGAAQTRILRADQQRLAAKLGPVKTPEISLNLVAALPIPVSDINTKARETMSNELTEGKELATIKRTSPCKKSPIKPPPAAGDSRHIQWLKTQVAQFESRLALAEAETARLKPVVTVLKSAIDALVTGPQKAAAMPPLKEEAGENGAATPKMGCPIRNSRNNQPARHVLPKLARRSDYDKLSIVDALKTELRKATEPLDQDSLIRAIFTLDDDNDDDNREIQRARGTVSSTLTHGAKKGLWRRCGDGRWKIEKGGMPG